MRLFSKTHFTNKIPTNIGEFIGLDVDKANRNLEVGDYFINIDPNFIVFIDKNWHYVWFLEIKNNKVYGEIKYNTLIDKTHIIKSSKEFINKCEIELEVLKRSIK
jgi:alkyl hydroperoxide reductase subunit AhpC